MMRCLLLEHGGLLVSLDCNLALHDRYRLPEEIQIIAPTVGVDISSHSIPAYKFILSRLRTQQSQMDDFATLVDVSLDVEVAVRSSGTFRQVRLCIICVVLHTDLETRRRIYRHERVVWNKPHVSA